MDAANLPCLLQEGAGVGLRALFEIRLGTRFRPAALLVAPLLPPSSHPRRPVIAGAFLGTQLQRVNEKTCRFQHPVRDDLRRDGLGFFNLRRAHIDQGGAARRALGVHKGPTMARLGRRGESAIPLHPTPWAKIVSHQRVRSFFNASASRELLPGTGTWRTGGLCPRRVWKNLAHP